MKKTITLNLLVSFVVLYGCSGSYETQTVEDKRSRASDVIDSNGKKQFTVSIGSLGLTSNNEIDIQSVSGSFAGCEDPAWSVQGSSGKVYASAACTDLVYQHLGITIDGVQHKLALNSSGIVDSSGQTWKFVSNGNDSVMLTANFSVMTKKNIDISNQEFGVKVDLDEGDGPICDRKNPFKLTSTPKNQIIVSLQPFEGKQDQEVSLAVAKNPADLKLPQVVVLNNTKQFMIDTTGLPNGTFIYKSRLIAKKGRSTCGLSQLTINVKNQKQKPAVELAQDKIEDDPTPDTSEAEPIQEKAEADQAPDTAEADPESEKPQDNSDTPMIEEPNEPKDSDSFKEVSPSQQMPPLLVYRTLADDDHDVFVELVVGGSVVSSKFFQSPKVNTELLLPNLCTNQRPSCLRVTFIGKTKQKAGDSSCVFTKKLNSQTIKVDVDTNGSGTIGTCKPGEDESYTFRCPKSQSLDIGLCK